MTTNTDIILEKSNMLWCQKLTQQCNWHNFKSEERLHLSSNNVCVWFFVTSFTVLHVLFLHFHQSFYGTT